MSRRLPVWAWGVGGAAAVVVLSVVTARNAGRVVDGRSGERPEARKAVMQQVLEASLPYRLAGLERRQLLSGEAMAEIARLHGSQLALTGGRVARYGEPPGVAVWTGQAARAEAARVMVAAMADRIAGGQSPLRLHPLSPDGIARASGLGQEHAFYASGTQVVWVAAAQGSLPEALREISQYLP